MMAYWKAAAVSRLLEYEAMEKAKQLLPEEIALCRPKKETEKEQQLNAMAKKTGMRQRLQWVRRWLRLTETGLGALTPEERLVLQMLYIAPRKGNVQRLCGLLGCEQSTVYRRRDRALQKFTVALYGEAPVGNLGTTHGQPTSAS